MEGGVGDRKRGLGKTQFHSDQLNISFTGFFLGQFELACRASKLACGS